MQSHWLMLPSILAASTSGHAATYLSVEQAQAEIFPKAKLSSFQITLTAEQCKAIAKSCGTKVRSAEMKAWREPAGGWFLVDDVLGKHEYITYAVGLGKDGSVQGIEILEYRETYGGEIRSERWRSQFVHKTSRDPLKLDNDIKNISGATLSSRHITDGVKRLLTVYELVLKDL